MSGIEDVIGPEIWAALDAAECRRCSVRRITWTLANPPQVVHHRWYFGLGRAYTGLFVAHVYPKGLPVPRGWRVWYEPGYDVLVVMPAWLAWILLAWRSRYGVLRLMHRHGLWRCPWGGHLWRDGRPGAPRWLRALVWCFLNDADHAPRDEHLYFWSNEDRARSDAMLLEMVRRHIGWMERVRIRYPSL
jgi:hypothetical protein